MPCGVAGGQLRGRDSFDMKKQKPKTKPMRMTQREERELLTAKIRKMGLKPAPFNPSGKFSILIACVLLSGCTTFHVTQTDESPNERVIRSEIKATAWFSSAQNVAKLKALQTDKTQSFGADTVGQQGATNTVEALKAIGNIIQMMRP